MRLFWVGTPVARRKWMSRDQDHLERDHMEFLPVRPGTGADPKGDRMAKRANAFETFRKRYRSVYDAYEALGGAAHEAGPLDQKTRELVKLGMAVGGRLEGAVRSHAPGTQAAGLGAREAGATPQEIEHVVLLAVTTVGFPTAVAAFTWVEELLAPRKRKTSRKI